MFRSHRKLNPISLVITPIDNALMIGFVKGIKLKIMAMLEWITVTRIRLKNAVMTFEVVKE